jgi:hypothetical protein
MNKLIFSTNKFKLIKIFTGLILLDIFFIHTFHTFFNVERNQTQLGDLTNTLGFVSLVIMLFAATYEEFIFRYFTTLKGWIGASWLYIALFLMSFFALKLVYPNSRISIFDISSLWILGILAIIFSISTFFKNYIFYKQIFLPSRLKNIISVLSFSLIHVINYNFFITNIYILSCYILVLHVPNAIFYSYLHLNYKYGFWIATGFHFTNNVLATILTLLLN